MKILILGSGGREHALAWKCSCSPKVDKVFVAPGNYGMERGPISCLAWNGQSDSLICLVKDKKIDLVVVGPEALLVKGVVDDLEKADISTVGPSQKASMLESSKVFAKNVMKKAGILTAEYSCFNDSQSARDFLEKNTSKKWVVKCDKLAAGKGVVVCDNHEEAISAVDLFLEKDVLGIQETQIVVEEKLLGREVSGFFLCDGSDFVTLGYACDYKALLDGGKGPNTGGMGAFSPVEWLTENLKKQIETSVVTKTLNEMNNQGIPFKGVLFVGMMIQDQRPYVLEYNVRFGDPETQVLLTSFKEDLVSYFIALTKGNLGTLEIPSFNKTSLVIVKSAHGYPGTGGVSTRKGDEIRMPAQISSWEKDHHAHVFFAGVSKKGEKLVTSGGRVLGVTVSSGDIHSARKKGYDLLDDFSFEGEYFRKDIGF